MKNAKFSRLGGFTLIELLVVVLIIGILAAMSLPQYFKAVERARMAEAISLMDSITKAQRRKFMQTNRYVITDFRALDVVPKGAARGYYFTKGDPATGVGGNGFKISQASVSGLFTVSAVAAKRMKDGVEFHPSLQYQYWLMRFFQSDHVHCFGINEAGKELCAEFCGVDTPSDECCDNGTVGPCPYPTDN